MKASGSYPTLVRGVSEQTPELRQAGQLASQVNMLSDPVEGLTRRPGTLIHGKATTVSTSTNSMEVDNYSVLKGDEYVTLEHTVDNKELVLLLRKTPATELSPTQVYERLLFVYNKTDGVFYSVNVNPSNTRFAELIRKGVAAATSVGRFVYLVGNDMPILGSSATLWNTGPLATKQAIWFRGPAYSRKFTLGFQFTTNRPAPTYTGFTDEGYAQYTNPTIRVTGPLVEFEYTTVPSQYPGELNTSDIPYSDPDYQKKVNDRLNAYNTQINEWIGEAARKVAPNSVASAMGYLSKDLTIGGAWVDNISGLNIKMQLDTSNPGAGSWRAINSTLYIDGPVNVTASDDGDGSLIRAVGNEVRSTTDVSTHHWYDKIVKVKPSGGDEAIYLRAEKKDQAQTGTFGEVTWTEAPGVKHQITGGLFFLDFDVATNTVTLREAESADVNPTSQFPTWASSVCGDNESSPMPFFVGKQVTYLGTFQDRLVVGCGAVVSMSRTKDYLNFFRATVLSVLPDDPIEMAATGSATDNIRASVLFDKNLLLFGDKRQYTVKGDTALVPTGANITTVSNTQLAAVAKPVVANSLIFFAQPGEVASSAHQFQVGLTENSVQPYPISTQLDRFLAGRPVELATSVKPDLLMMRLTGLPNGLAVFQYLDTDQGRRQDAWYKWEFNQALGNLIGVVAADSGPMLFFVGNEYIAAHTLPLAGGASDRPYLDGMEKVTSIGTLNWHEENVLAYGEAGAASWFGIEYEDRSQAASLRDRSSWAPLWFGYKMGSEFSPTNPYPLDQNNQPITTGRATISSFRLSFKNSTGFTAVVDSYNEQEQRYFNGRILGLSGNTIGLIPVTTGEYVVRVGREVRKFSMTVKANKWYPLTITAIEWVGQFFNNVRR